MTKIEYKDTIPDAKEYLELFDSTGWNAVLNVNVAELDKVLRKSWYVVTAYDTEKLIGIGRIVSDGILYAMIYDLIVIPSYQGRGIGTEILKKLTSRCKKVGVREIQLFSAKGKVSYYCKRGFVERPTDAPGMRLYK